VAAVITVIVRAKDEAASIGRTLDLLARQQVPRREVEVIVVDSGSTDGTVAIARGRGARVIEIPAERFTFGGSLNCGAAAARGSLLVALSAHAFPPDDGWLARLAAHFEDDRVACACYGLKDPDGAPLHGPYVQDAATARRVPEWGYSNAAGAFRAELWRAYPFRWDMPGCEDKEWALHWLERGFVCVVDPAVLTDHDHSGDSVPENFERYRREWVGLRMYTGVERWSLRSALRVWWREPRGWPSLWRARRSPRRAARIAGEWWGRRWVVPPAPDVAIFADRFPELSETFVGEEAAALCRAGHRVSVEARGRPNAAGEVPAAVRVHRLGDETRTQRLTALAWLALRHPRRCGRDLRDRRAWAQDEHVEPLRRLAVRARRLARHERLHLHAHFAGAAALDALRLGRLLGVPVSVTAHAYDIYLDARNLRRKLLAAEFATSGCDYTVSHLRDLAGPPHAGGVLKVVMGVDARTFRRLTPLPGARHVVAVGRLIEKKGFLHLVRAAALLDDVQVTIAGDGPQRAALEAEVQRLGLGDRVHLPGATGPSGVRDLLERADLLCMPCVVAADGDRDSMPVVVKEAMAMELCVVASDEVGLPEIVREPWGRLAPPGDHAALAAAITGLLDGSPEERAAAGRAARAHVLACADVDRETAKLSTFIRAAQTARA
jgi:rhamnosyltransferase